MLELVSIWIATVAVDRRPVVGEPAIWSTGNKEYPADIKYSKSWEPEWPKMGSIWFIANGREWKFRYVIKP